MKNNLVSSITIFLKCYGKPRYNWKKQQQYFHTTENISILWNWTNYGNWIFKPFYFFSIYFSIYLFIIIIISGLKPKYLICNFQCNLPR